MFTLNLLGPVTAAIDDQPFSRFGTIRGQALLIYLALENDHAHGSVRAHSREALMHLLWPDMPLKSAQGNLRQTLYLLRKGFEDAGLTEPPILSARQTVQLNPDFPLAVDVHQFEAFVAAGTLQSRQQAADLYRGSFLADFYLPDSEPFEEWVGSRRAAGSRLALDNLDQLAAHYLAQAEYAEAVTAARRAIALDNLHEPAHRHLLQALAGAGNRSDALTHYDAFASQLAEELNIEPDETTNQLIQSIRLGQLTAITPALRETKTSDTEEAKRLHPKSHIPAQTKPFIGRLDELQQLDHFFAAPDTRLVTILGPGGMGKTQLAIQWARGQVGANGQTGYADGVHFVDLAPLESIDQVAPAMAETFTFPLQGERRSPEEQMLDYLREKKLLLILDNFEHIIEASDFVNDILHSAPGVDILVTSRERLHLSSEQIYAIEGLVYPSDPGHEDGVTDLESYPAVQLLLRSARRLHPHYQLRAEDQEPAARICQYTAGMPLAIELAASLIDLMPLNVVAGKIERCLDVLESDLRDLPQRHRSIRAAINTTWNHLGPDEQDTFATLSIFRGDFTWDAATAVLGHDRSQLALRRVISKLRDKSLLMYDARSERFTMHELLRQYGAEKLAAADASPAQERHALYYAGLLANSDADLKGSQFSAASWQIEADLENCLAAWHWLVENEDLPQLAASMDTLALFHEIRGYYATGLRIFKLLSTRWRERLADQAVDSEETARDLRFLAKSLAGQAAFELDRHKAESLLQESLALLDDPRLDEGQGKAERAFAYLRLGQRLQDSQMNRAIDYLEKGLALYQELDDVRGAADCLLLLGLSTFFINLSKSKQYLLQAGDIFEEIGDTRRLGQTLNWLIGVVGLKGDFETMEQVVAKFQALVASIEQPAFVDETLFVNILIAEEKGQYAQAAVYREEYVRRLNKLGRAALMSNVYLAYIYLHAGQVDQGRFMLQQMLREIKETAVEHDHRLAFCRHALATQALADEEFTRARHLLQHAMPIYEKNRTLPDLAGANSLLGIALFGLDDLTAARSHLFTGLKMALDLHGFLPLGETLLGIALVLADQGRTRQARRLYELIWRYPRYNRSVLYESMAGQKIRALTANIPPADLQTIQQQAAESDIWQASTTLLDQLTTQGWPN